MPFLSSLAHIKAIILDVDGVLTDGTVLVNENGDQLRRYNVRDGYAIKVALKHGFRIAAISGGKAKNISLRLNGLGIEDVYLDTSEKTGVYEDFKAKYSLKDEEILYMGDDIPDLPLMKVAGSTACPADAMEDIKQISSYISPFNGGYGCVRDVFEKLLKIQGKWLENDGSFVTSA